MKCWRRERSSGETQGESTKANGGQGVEEAVQLCRGIKHLENYN